MGSFEKSDFDIAVIGMACRFPEAGCLDEFYHNLTNGRDCIDRTPASSDRKDYINAYGKVRGKYDFDCGLFGIKPEKAAMADPQQRVLTEVVYEALADSGNRGDAVQTGIFAGSDEFTYVWKRICAGKGFDEDRYLDRTLLLSGSLCSWISYLLNLKGSCMTVRSACSTSLAAVHFAVVSLRNFECDMCIAGGVAINENDDGYRLSENTLSTDGYTRSFDKKGTGFVPGNGCGAVVLKRLGDALRDKDRIYAVIRETSINNDGNEKAGYTAPGLGGITSAVRDAYSISGIDPALTGYVECHGTGTVLGDAVELQALGSVIKPGIAGGNSGAGAEDPDTERPDGNEGVCRIGSVKSNIGHTNMASGIASFIKTVLMLCHRQFFPSLHCDEPNDAVGTSGFEVATALSDWKAERRIAGVNSYGIGGTNCFVLLEGYEDRSDDICKGIPGRDSGGTGDTCKSDPSRDLKGTDGGQGAHMEPLKSEDDLIYFISAQDRNDLIRKFEFLRKFAGEKGSDRAMSIAKTLLYGRSRYRYRAAGIIKSAGFPEAVDTEEQESDISVKVNLEAFISDEVRNFILENYQLYEDTRSSEEQDERLGDVQQALDKEASARSDVSGIILSLLHSLDRSLDGDCCREYLIRGQSFENADEIRPEDIFDDDLQEGLQRDFPEADGGERYLPLEICMTDCEDDVRCRICTENKDEFIRSIEETAAMLWKYGALDKGCILGRKFEEAVRISVPVKFFGHVKCFEEI